VGLLFILDEFCVWSGAFRQVFAQFWSIVALLRAQKDGSAHAELLRPFLSL